MQINQWQEELERKKNVEQMLGEKEQKPPATQGEFKPICESGGESGAAGRHTILQKWGPLKGDILEIQNIEYRVKEVKGQNLVLRPTGRIRQRTD